MLDVANVFEEWMKSNQKWLRLGVLAILISLALFCSIQVYSSVQNALMPNVPTPSVNCFAGYAESMTPEQMADLMGVPLVKFTWLPEDVKTTPQVEPFALQHVDSSSSVTCVLRITYPGEPPPQRTDLIDLRLFPINLWQDPFPVDCYPLSEKYGNLKSHCTGVVSVSRGDIAVSMFTAFSPEIAKKITERMIVAD